MQKNNDKRLFSSVKTMMNDDLSKVVLLLSDIPGAELSKPWEQNSIVALRWWLLCRGISVRTSWKKVQLIQRYIGIVV